jgi:hypothetical protein
VSALYRGVVVEPDVYRVSVIEPDGTGRSLPLRLDLFNHSPSGFAWGYPGSGPAQLALAILADAIGDDARAVRLHQAFKRACIERLDGDRDWQMSREEVRVWVALQLPDMEGDMP